MWFEIDGETKNPHSEEYNSLLLFGAIGLVQFYSSIVYLCSSRSTRSNKNQSMIVWFVFKKIR